MNTTSNGHADTGESTATKSAAAPTKPMELAASVSPGAASRNSMPKRYLGILFGITMLGMLGIWQGNKRFAPEMYDPAGSRKIAEALSEGKNYALFDLNINIREIRDEQIARMKEAPEVVVLGASHWQEAHADLMPGKRFFNAHVHRDYYEDLLGVTEMFVRHDKLPKQMIIAIRDNQFTPVSMRKDYLWLPGIPYYRAMAARLGLKTHSTWETLPAVRWRELASLPMLYSNAARWYKAPTKPQATREYYKPDMDLLLPGGSIIWSGEHQRLFSPQRAEKLAEAFAASNRNAPPPIDPKGVEAVDVLLSYLKGRGIEVVLAHPPFNPDYYEHLAGTPYMAGLRKVENLTKDLASKHGLKIIGSFDPNKVGCEDNDYIDAEHANPECLGKLLKQFLDLQPVAAQPIVPAVANLAPETSKAPVSQASKPAPARQETPTVKTQRLAALEPQSAQLPPVMALQSPAQKTAQTETTAGPDPTRSAAPADALRTPRAGKARQAAHTGAHTGKAHRAAPARPRLAAASRKAAPKQAAALRNAKTHLHCTRAHADKSGRTSAKSCVRLASTSKTVR